MQHWNEGYFSDFSYTASYYQDINPLLINFYLLLAGIKTNTMNDKLQGGGNWLNEDFNYLELGCGAGVSVNIHAATIKGHFTGVDFNPDHIAYAKDYVSSSNISLHNDSFKEFLARLEKEKINFDYICFHGIFSWISEENQNIILELIRKFLKVGGVVYNSYNCFPGSSFLDPLRGILLQHHRRNASTSMDLHTQIAQSVDFLSEFAQTQPFAMQNPNVQTWLKAIEKHKSDSNLTYLAHEYFNSHYRNFYFYEIAQMMENAKCSFALNTELLNSYGYGISEQAKAFLSKITDPIFKEQLNDYYINRNFRADIFIKGIQRFSYNETMQRVLNTEFVLTKTSEAFNDQINIACISLTLNKKLYEQVLAFLESESYRPKSARELMQKCNADFSGLIIMILVLIKQNMLFPTQKIDKTIKQQARAYNENLFNKQIQNEANFYVAAPLIGSCIAVGPLEQMIMKVYLQNITNEKELVSKTFTLFKESGKEMTEEAVVWEDSQVIKNIEDNVKVFLEKLPLYKVLGILD